MQRTRKLNLCICDYSNNVVCDLYDNQSDISGQAANVFIDTERNGWKELTFDIPSTCMSEEGEIENYRLKYLIAEYKIRAIDDDGTDWFIISEPQIKRNTFSKNVSVKAGHISQLLKHKSLDLEFSDEEGNNVATADKLLDTILEGTGWHRGYVEEFRDDDGTIKVRSLSASAGTGALSLIESLCDVFEAKPVYHGDKTVDIISMNPFAKIDPEMIPQTLLEENTDILELYYNRNIHSLNKTTNTENMATRLYAYGSAGDMNGLCSLQTALHNEWTFVIDELGLEYKFEIGSVAYFFEGEVAIGDTLIWSDMDITSMTYVYNDTQKVAYRVYKKPTEEHEDIVVLTETDVNEVENEFAYLLGLKYYDDVGLMTEEQFQAVATFQRDIPAYLRLIKEKSEAFIDGEAELSKIAEHSNGLLKLDIDHVENNDGTKFYIKTSTGEHGVIYRTDYEQAERRYFKWHVTDQLNKYGDPVTGTPSLLFVVHDTDPVTYDMTYLKCIWDSYGNLVVDDNNKPKDFEYSYGDYPTAFTVWNTVPFSATDRVYLFCTNSMAGLLGARLSHVEAIYQELDSITMRHPVTFHEAGTPVELPVDSEFEWRYDYYPDRTGELYFCWAQMFDEHSWRRVYVTDTEPTVSNTAYWYNTRHRELYRWNNEWVKIEDKQTIVTMFASVIYLCYERDQLYRGIYEYYFRNGALDMGNYAIFDGYNTYWSFKLKDEAEENILLDYVNDLIYPDVETENDEPVFVDGKPQFSVDNIISPDSVGQDAVFYPSENEIKDKRFYPGSIDMTDGTEYSAAQIYYRTGYIDVEEQSTYYYNLPVGSAVYLYEDGVFDTSVNINLAVGSFTTGDSNSIRVVVPEVQETSYIKLDLTNDDLLQDRPFVDGNINPDGTNKDTDRYRCYSIQAYENTLYEFNLPENCSVYFYNINLKYLGGLSLTTTASTGTFTTPPTTYFMRFVSGVQNPAGYVRIQDYDKKFYRNREMYYILDSIEYFGELIGITPLVGKFADIVDLTYEDYLYNLRLAQQQVKDRENALANLLDDMLKDGRWQDSNYIYGDEKRLYDDAMYMHRQISMPEVTYSFTYLDMYEQKTSLCPCDEEQKVGADWPDIKITFVAHLIDTESNTNCWAYIDKINKCYDQPWKTTVEIDTKLTLASRHGFTDVIARIAEVSKEIKAKQSLYDRAATGNIEGSRLEGVVSINQIYLNGGSSNWYNDESGNLVFEAADGQSAMLLGGRGLGVATSKAPTGEWEWRTAATGYGLTADAITAGYIDAERIDAGTVTLDKLASNVGKELEIGSNQALMLYATVDGSRPAGSLKTTDGYIEVRAGHDDVPAKINIVSGGELNLNGGDINIYSEGKLDISSGGQFELSANGADSMNSTANGLYINSEEGINFGGGRFKVQANGSSSTVYMVAGYMALGTSDSENNKATIFRLDNNIGKIEIKADNEIDIAANKTLKLISNKGNVVIGNGTSPFIVGADTITYTDNNDTVSYDRAFIYNGRTDIQDESHDGVYLGTDGINVGKVGGSHVIATADGDVDISGTIYATNGEIGSWTIGNTLHSGSGDNYVSLGANGDYRIWAGSETPSTAKFSVKKDGTLYAIKGTVGGWTLGSDFIGNNTVKNSSTVGMAAPSGTNIVFWAGGNYNGTGSGEPKFWVKSDGTLKASLGTVGGWYIGSDYIGNASTKANSTVCIASYGLAADDNSKVFWAGGTTSPKFYVTKSGKLYASGAEITGSSTFSGTLSANCISGGTIDASTVTINNLNASKITGGTLTLGGTSNAVLSIKDANNNVIGSWTNAGISATKGDIGGWTIATNSLHSGSGSSYVELNSNSASDFAIWAGDSSTSSAPFRVKRDGSVYLTQLITRKKELVDGQYVYTDQIVNLSGETDSGNRLCGATITGWNESVGKIYTTYGDINFNSAASLQLYWDGNKPAVKNINTGVTLITGEQVLIGTHVEQTGTLIQAYHGSGPSWITGTSKVATLTLSNSASDYSSTTKAQFKLDGTEVSSLSLSLSGYWNTAFSSGQGDVGLELDTTNYLVKVKNGSSSKQYTVSVDTTVAGASGSKKVWAKVNNTRLISGSVTAPNIDASTATLGDRNGATKQWQLKYKIWGSAEKKYSYLDCSAAFSAGENQFSKAAVTLVGTPHTSDAYVKSASGTPYYQKKTATYRKAGTETVEARGDGHWPTIREGNNISEASYSFEYRTILSSDVGTVRYIGKTGSTTMYKKGSAYKYYDIGSNSQYYWGNGGTKTVQGAEVTVDVIDTSKSLTLTGMSLYEKGSEYTTANSPYYTKS